MFRIVFLCIGISALKLPQDPKFEVDDVLNDAECENRYSFKCWRKGGHSLEPEEAAYITNMEWVALDLAAATNRASVKVTWNKVVTAAGTPILKVNWKDGGTDTNVDCPVVSPLTGSSLVFTATTGDTSATAEPDKFQIKADAIKTAGSKTIKNAGKSKNANVENVAAPFLATDQAMTHCVPTFVQGKICSDFMTENGLINGDSQSPTEATVAVAGAKCITECVDEQEYPCAVAFHSGNGAGVWKCSCGTNVLDAATQTTDSGTSYAAQAANYYATLTTC